MNAFYGKRPLLFRAGPDGVVRTYGFNVYNAMAGAPVRLSATLLPNCPAGDNFNQRDEAPPYPAGCLENNAAYPVTYFNLTMP